MLQQAALITTFNECETQWDRRSCASRHRDYAFIVPRDPHAAVRPEAFDALRMFGADMCAKVLPPTAAPYVRHATACPRCGRLS